MPEDSTSNAAQPVDVIDFADFLQSIPPMTKMMVKTEVESINVQTLKIKTPILELYCSSESCQGVRYFDVYTGSLYLYDGSTEIIKYKCRNCKEGAKTYALIAWRVRANVSSPSHIMKLGEFPVFGPPLPAKLITLIGPDRDALLKGRQCENQGLGIGAFAYYRRIVENQKGRLLNEVARVLKHSGADPGIIARVEMAATETQFSKAIENTKDLIPPSLLISGRNPLLLLHSALSKGVHDRTDEECLQMATNIRIVLTEFSERMAQAMKDTSELKRAVDNLMKS